jgi:hypothetical protein
MKPVRISFSVVPDSMSFLTIDSVQRLEWASETGEGRSGKWSADKDGAKPDYTWVGNQGAGGTEHWTSQKY